MHTSPKKQKRKKVTLVVLIFVATVLVVAGITFVTYQNVFAPATTTPEIVDEKQAQEEEKSKTPEPKETPSTVTTLFEYVEITDSCDAHYEGECLRVRSGPGSEFPVVARVRNGVVLKVAEKVERDGVVWYKIIFDEWLRYPERITDEWYIARTYVTPLSDEGDLTIWDNEYGTTTKKIIVDRSEQKLYAYEGDDLFMEIPISTGLELTPTPRGTFSVFKKTPSRYMQGPLPDLIDQQVYDLPGVPWNLYFTQEGAVIHGAYWHTSFGRPYSHGCVNLLPSDAHTLYIWAVLGTTVTVRD